MATSTRWFLTRIFMRASYLLGKRNVTTAVPSTTAAKMNTTRPLRRNKAPAPSRRLNELRSEEHTSELQSHLNLVCRLLLEKKTPDHCLAGRRRSQKIEWLGQRQSRTRLQVIGRI